MSMNLHLRGEREVVVKKTGKASCQYKSFDLIQTPTEETYKILNSSNIFEAYKDFVLNRMSTEFWEKQEESVYNAHREELIQIIKDTEAWIKAAEEEGYEIKFFAM